MNIYIFLYAIKVTLPLPNRLADPAPALVFQACLTEFLPVILLTEIWLWNKFKIDINITFLPRPGNILPNIILKKNFKKYFLSTNQKNLSFLLNCAKKVLILGHNITPNNFHHNCWSDLSVKIIINTMNQDYQSILIVLLSVNTIVDSYHSKLLVRPLIINISQNFYSKNLVLTIHHNYE